jgi:Fe-S oxidoreductase
VNKRIKIEDISKPSSKLSELRKEDFMPLPPPFDKLEDTPDFATLSDKAREQYESSLDDIIAVGIPKPKNKKDEDELVAKFLSGLEKLFSKENNWTFLQPLMLSMEHCAACHTCSDSCHIYEASGKNPIYRPAYRSEVFRRLYKNYVKSKGGLLAAWRNGEIELNWTTVARLAELSYRCNLCRRCAQTCPIGVDNGLIAHEIRKLFSQEMGIAPEPLHEKGTVQQLNVGASTGINPTAFADIVDFLEDEMEEKLGRRIKIPIDKKKADILLIHNSGEFLSWPLNPMAFAIILELAGIDYTLSSELGGYEGTNYGVWYDDLQLARVVMKQTEVARKLGVNKIVVGECGHAHKAMIVTSDRLFTEETIIPRESCFPLLEEIVFSGKIKLDPSKNDFPVTLHDPCNMVRLMGIVEPQRRILRHIAPLFREMTPNGVYNYCCGGGSGFAIMSPSKPFVDWKLSVSGRMKVKQVLEAFGKDLGKDKKNYLCAPCSNCKGQLRDLIEYYDLQEKYGIYYDGLVELIVNAIVDIKEPFIEWGEM